MYGHSRHTIYEESRRRLDAHFSCSLLTYPCWLLLLPYSFPCLCCRWCTTASGRTTRSTAGASTPTTMATSKRHTTATSTWTRFHHTCGRSATHRLSVADPPSLSRWLTPLCLSVCHQVHRPVGVGPEGGRGHLLLLGRQPLRGRLAQGQGGGTGEEAGGTPSHQKTDWSLEDTLSGS